MNPEENNNQVPSTGPTPQPTSTPPFSTTPAAEPTPEPTPTPAPEPTPEVAPAVEPTPESVPTPAPEAAAEPTPESIPTPAPEAAAEPTPEVAPATEPSPEPTPEPAPSLDQVAADLTSAAATNSLESSTETSENTLADDSATSIDSGNSMPASDPTSPVDITSGPTSSFPGSVSTEAASPIDTASQVATPTTPSADSAHTTEPVPVSSPALNTEPTMSADASLSAELNSTIGNTLLTDQATTSETTASSNTNESTIPPAGTDIESEEPPLVPAEPVPGSIGSAISYSDSTPDHSAPTTKPKNTLSLAKTLKLSKENMRLVAIIGIGIVLVAVVVVVLIFIIHGSSSPKKTTSSNTNTTTNTQPIISSVTCAKEGGADAFPTYGELTTAKSEIVAMYRNNELTSFGTNFRAEYPTLEAANFGQSVARDEYNQKLIASNLTSDPFESNYNIIDNVLTVTHQADADDIDASNARALDLYVVSGEVIDDPDTVIDEYEGKGFICEEK